MRKFLSFILKCIAAGIVSMVLLSIFALVYYNPPIAIEQKDGTTNFKYIPDSAWTFMLEGVGFGKTDALGYNNAYYKNLTNPDIVVMGSSHMEGLQVPANKNCIYLLNELFDKDNLSYNDFKCFNLGASGHFLGVTSSNFQYIANRYKDSKYLIIEVSELEFSDSMLEDIISDEYRTPFEDKGVIQEAAQKVPFIRLLYKKINEIKSAKPTSPEVSVESVKTDKKDEIDNYSAKMNVILEEISSLSRENNIKTIILIHERFWENKDRKIETEIDTRYKTAFLKCCELNNIKVIDATPDMIKAYKENYVTSYGFSNTTPGEGHLNEAGHSIIAKTLYHYINGLEENK